MTADQLLNQKIAAAIWAAVPTDWLSEWGWPLYDIVQWLQDVNPGEQAFRGATVFSLNYAFTWKDTPQGHDFWQNVDIKCREHYHTSHYFECDSFKQDLNSAIRTEPMIAALGANDPAPEYCDICGVVGHSMTCPRGPINY